jgi:PAS domain-containing protein
MNTDNKASQNIIWAIFLLYSAPTFILTLYSMELYNLQKSSGILSLGLILNAAGSLLMFLLLRQWEQSLDATHQEEPLYSVPSNDEDLKILQAELNTKSDELQKFYDNIDKFAAYKEATEDELRKKEALLNEFQETITKQRDVLKKRQEQVSELEGKIHDLNYEVNTLLDVVKISETTDMPPTGMQLKETAGVYQVTPPPTHVKSAGEADVQLKRCMDIAGKITGANHFETANSKFRDWHIDNYALDLRRLFDNLRGESSCTIFVFSQKDNRLLFVNNQAKHLLGWSPEKFVQSFPEIIADSLPDWNRGISRLANQTHTTAEFNMKNKAGQNVSVNCHLGMISAGLFRNHIIGVVFQAHSNLLQ